MNGGSSGRPRRGVSGRPSPGPPGARIALLDYGMGNLRSVEKALERVGAEVEWTSDPKRAREADGVVLPGVGAFPKAMKRIRELRLDELVSERAGAGVPVLGICLGLQLLFESSQEGEGAAGLGLLRGEVTRLRPNGLKTPHIGWSPVRWQQPAAVSTGLGKERPFYFVHSFAPRPVDQSDLLGTAEYGERFACAVVRENIFGVQFHPEKSSADGLALLRNFAALCTRRGHGGRDRG
ncbi:MAG: imidazole glycerol phosphate synthase subunit HisH [Solirubrobacterales bacterium]